MEFALVFPVFVMFAFGSITGGLALSRSLVLSHAAREAARFGSVLAFDQELESGSSWAEVVRQVAIDRAGGDVSPEDVCVALVGGHPPRAVSTLHTTRSDGGACWADDEQGDELRVQVLIRGRARLEAIFFATDLELRGQALARAELDLPEPAT